MRGSELLEKLSLADSAYVETAAVPPRTTKKFHHRWAAAAACIALLAVAGGIWLSSAPAPTTTPGPSLDGSVVTEPEPDNQTEGPRPVWEFHYNEAQAMTDAARPYIPGYFQEPLSEAELEAVQPGMWIDWMNFTGTAGFDGEGQLQEVYLWVTTTDPDTTVTVILSPDGPASCCLLPEDAVSSYCSGVEYMVSRWESDGWVTLLAESQLHGVWLHFSVTVTADREEQARSDFEEILESFTVYTASQPDLSAITAQEIPQWQDTALTQAEALADPDFGAYFLSSPPSGFAEESIRRYQDQHTNALWGLWARGYDELRWEVRQMTEEDSARLVDVSQREQYDLSLYPIPRADSVPEQLRDIVDHPIFQAEDLTLEIVTARANTVSDAGDSDGIRMDFAVRYGEVIVEVQSKGVDVQWLYEQLIALRP